MALGITSALSSWGCVGPDSATEIPTQKVLYWGCQAVRGDSKAWECLPNPELEMVVWAEGRSCDDTLLIENGEPLKTTKRQVRDGCQFRITEKSTRLAATLELTDKSSGESLWKLKLDRSKADLFAWKRRIWDRATVDLAGVVAELDQKSSQVTEAERILDYTYASAIASKRLGHIERALQSYRELGEQAARAGYLSVAFDAAYRQALILHESGLSADAISVLSAARAFLIPEFAQGLALHGHLMGTILHAQGRPSDAITELQRALADAERVDYRSVLLSVVPLLTEFLVAQDRRVEALDLLRHLEQLQEGATACEKANLLQDKAWSMLQLAGEPSAPNPTVRAEPSALVAAFMAALESRKSCEHAGELGFIYAGLALATFHEGSLAEAATWAARARDTKALAVDEEAPLVELDARIALAGGHPADALDKFKKLAAFAQSHPDNEKRLYECKAAVGAMESLSALGQEDSAIRYSVRGCLDPKTSGLAPLNVRQMTQRASILGISL